MRLHRDGVDARANCPDYRSLLDSRVAHDRCGAELEEGHGESVGRENGDDAAAVRHGADERHGAGRGCANALSFRRADVDPPMLPGRVRVGGERERAQHRPVYRPCPGVGRRRNDQR